MRTLLKKATLGAVLAATTLTAAAPAEAQWRGRYYRDRDNTGTAIVAGIAGLAIGAALTSGRDRYDPRYRYDYNYYDQRGYFPQDGYYARNYYNRNRGWNDCYVRRVYDPYIGRNVRVRYCDRGGW